MKDVKMSSNHVSRDQSLELTENYSFSTKKKRKRKKKAKQVLVLLIKHHAYMMF